MIAPEKENEEGGTDQVLELMFPSVSDVPTTLGMKGDRRPDPKVWKC